MNDLKIFGAFLLLIGTGACGTKTVQPKFGLLSVDTTFRAGPLDYTVQYEFATIANADESAQLRAIEEANIGYFFSLEDFQGSARDAAAAAVAQLIEENRDYPEPDARVNWEASLTVTSEVALVDTVLVYTIAYSSYTGGAHGVYGMSTHNYSLSGGYELELSDLFNDGQQAKLAAIIRDKLYDKFDVSSDDGLIERGFFPEYIDVTENFALTEDGGIVFCYNPYDIGCYALGGQEIEVSREELDRLTE